MRSFLRVLGRLLILALVFSAGMGVHLWSRRSSTWTDGVGISRTAEKGEIRYVLWEKPKALELGMDPDNTIEPAVSADGQILVFSKGKAGYNTELFEATRQEDGWSEPVKIESLNSSADELGPALNRKGDRIWFTSNRDGGIGGYDIWTARKQYGVWEEPILLDGRINSTHDEYDPVVDAGENQLVFSSNRPLDLESEITMDAWKGTLRERVSTTHFDIYTAARVGGDVEGDDSGYFFEPAARWKEVNSEMDEGQPAFSPHGDFLYFSSNREGGKGGFDLYRMRLFPQDEKGLQPLPSPVNTEGDEMDPALWHEGHSLVFSSNAGQEEPYTFRLWTTTSREVILQPWMSWARLNSWFVDFGLWGALLLAALLGIAWLWWLLYRSESTLGPRARALTVSALVHALALFLLSIWFLGSAVVEQTSGPMEIRVSEQNMVREKLSLELREEVAEIELPQTPILQERVAMPDPVTPPSLPEALDISLPKVSTAPSAFEVVDQVKQIDSSDTVLPEMSTPVMEVPDLPLMEVEVADLSDFSDLQVLPEITLPKLTVQTESAQDLPGGPGEIERASSEIEVSALMVAQEVSLSDTLERVEGAEVIPVDAGVLEASDGMEIPELALLDNLDIDTVALPEFAPSLRMSLDTSLEPTISYHLRDPAVRRDVLEELGGNDETEAAIQQALEFFVRTQEEDGRWDMSKWKGESGHDVAATGLVMLCFMGYGVTHQAETTHQAVMIKSLDWLIAQQNSDGRIASKDMYDHGIATIALAEAFAMTQDEKLRIPLELAVDYLVSAQHDGTGGWRYKPNQPGDTSVFGWALLGIASARQSGIEIPERAFAQAEKYLDRVAGGKEGGRYGYENRNAKRRAMTAQGFFGRQLLNTPREQANMQESARYLSTQLPQRDKVDMYYWYYGCLSLYQHQGEIWEKWNNRMRPILVRSQKTNGDLAGSWDPEGSYGDRMGRIVTTALATLSLEVYYRYLPMYQW